jgi:hypothetical protein
MTICKLPKWACNDIDSFRRSFLWRVEDPDKVHGGHCLVKWKVCIRPKKWGTLGIKDLDKFGRALRLHWLWHSWDECDRSWKNLLRHHDQTDRALFFTSTLITVGNGKNTPFWEAWWLNGMAPKELAPHRFQQARYHYRTVHQELKNFNWIKNIKNINTEETMDEFILLFSVVNDVSLNDGKY